VKVEGAEKVEISTILAEEFIHLQLLFQLSSQSPYTTNF